MNLKEIAQVANVSLSTVSLVLNNKKGVSQDRREQIAKLLIENGYILNSDRNSGQGKNSKIEIRLLKYAKHGMLVEGNPGFVLALIDSLEWVCRKNGCGMSLTTVTDSNLDEIIQMIQNESPAGIFLIGTEMEDEQLNKFRGLSIPTVVIDNTCANTELSSVTMDNDTAITREIEFLREKGHRSIGFLANSNPASNCRAREWAFIRGIIGTHDSDKIQERIFPVEATPEGAYQSVKKLIAEGVRFPSALIANNDSIALGTLRAFTEAGIKVPENVSLMGFDDIPYSSVSMPALTTVHVSCRLMAIWAFKLLNDFITYSMDVPVKIRVGTELIVRNSVIEASKQLPCPYTEL